MVLNKYENVKFDDFIFNLYGKHINELKINELEGRKWGWMNSYLPDLDRYVDYGDDEPDDDFILEQLMDDYKEIGDKEVIIEEHEMIRNDGLRKFRVIWGNWNGIDKFFDYYLDFDPMKKNV